jgi:hypothetical protein
LFAAELVFDGSVRVISGDNFVPSLGNNTSTLFMEMALKYQNMVSITVFWITTELFNE